MMIRRCLRTWSLVLVVSGSIGGGVVAAPAASAEVLLECRGTTTLRFDLGMRVYGTPQLVRYEHHYQSCTGRFADPSLTAGGGATSGTIAGLWTFGERPRVDTCRPLDPTGQERRQLVWNSGEQSTFEFTSTYAINLWPWVDAAYIGHHGAIVGGGSLMGGATDEETLDIPGAGHCDGLYNTPVDPKVWTGTTTLTISR